MFDQLKAVRDTLANIPAFDMSPSARAKLLAAIDKLDDSMVMWVRAEQHVRDNPQPQYAEQYATAGIC